MDFDETNSPQRYEVSELIPQVMLVTLPTGSSQLLSGVPLWLPHLCRSRIRDLIGLYLPRIKKDPVVCLS